MSNKRTWTVVALLTALSLIVPMSARAGSYGHHGGHGYYGHRGYHGYGNHYGYHSGYGYHGYSGHHGYYGHGGYYGHHTPHFYGPDGGRYRAVGEAGNLGAIDINVKPKRTRTYLNGNYIGMTGRFDGFPDYLWLEEGTYELAFYNEGYLTVIQEFAIRAGAVVDVKLRLVPGRSVPPEELISRVPVGHESD